MCSQCSWSPETKDKASRWILVMTYKCGVLWLFLVIPFFFFLKVKMHNTIASYLGIHPQRTCFVMSVLVFGGQFPDTLESV